MNFERLGAMVKKEFVQMRRDPATLRIVLAVPVMQLLIFGFAIRTDVRNLPTVVFDQSRSQQSRAFVQKLTATDNFVRIAQEKTPDPAYRGVTCIPPSLIVNREVLSAQSLQVVRSETV